MKSALSIGVLALGAWAIVALCVQLVRARGFGRRAPYAPPASDPWSGVAYAFGVGMSPTAKESVREHLPSYFAGMGYHVGIFTSLGYLALLLAGVPVGGAALLAVRALCLIGAGCGAVLLLRRLLTPQLRQLSCPDDVVANVLTTAFVGLAFVRTLTPAADVALLGGSMALFLYIPLGKIRHCFFFFTTRAHLGAWFGRRGTFPPAHPPGGGWSSHA